MSLRRRTRPLRHALAWGALRAFAFALNLLPLRPALALSAGLGRVAGLFARRDTRRMRANLAAARLERTPLPGDCWGDLGRRLGEVLLAERVLPLFHLGPADEARLQAALAGGRGVLVATCHLGNWELMAAALARRGIPVRAIAARHGDGPLYRALRRFRSSHGVVTCTTGGGARAGRTVLRGRGALAVFVDQRTGERSRSVTFFGRPAPTPATLERLLAATGAVLLFAFTVREAGGTHRVHIEAVPEDAPPLDALTARIEALVRANPTQWIWQHDRWPGSC